MSTQMETYAPFRPSRVWPPTFTPAPRPRIRVVTTFGRAQWDAYAHALLPQSIERWSGVEWQVWLDDERLAQEVGGAPNVTCYSLEMDAAHERFMARWAAMTAKAGRAPASYLFDAGRFAHKVFALTSDAARKNTDTLIWLDADVETLKPVDPEWLASLLGENDIAYLGRKDMLSAETAFLMFRIQESESSPTDARPFLNQLRNIYTSGDIYAHREWIDGYAVARLAAQFGPAHCGNLSDGLPGLDVFERTKLGERLRHHKGPVGKAQLQQQASG